MIIEIPNENSIVKWKNNDKDEWKAAEISDLIKAYERPQGEWEESHIISCGNILRMGINVIEHKCKDCGRWSIQWDRTIPDNFCSNCGAKIKGGAE